MNKIPLILALSIFSAAGCSHITSEQGKVVISETEVEVSSSVIDFGTITFPDTIYQKVKITNKGQNPFIINSIERSCGCTAAGWDEKPIAPDSATIVKIRVIPGDKGYFFKRIAIYSNAKRNPIIITVKGSVQ